MIDSNEFNKQRLFGIDFDVVTMQDAVEWVFRCAAMGCRSKTRYVVTPNVSLTLLHQKCSAFRKIVHHADLTIVDGMPLVKASRWFGRPLPERVAGSDLVYSIFEAAIEEVPLRVFLLGAAPGVADRAAEEIAARWPAVNIVGTLSPGFGFERDSEQNQQILKTVNQAEPDVLIVGLGAPKQETWAYNNREQISAAVTLCVGGTIDFIAGEQKRAPDWFRKSGLEWSWRMLTNPRRLVKRYVRDAIRLPRLFLNELSGLCPFYQANDVAAVTADSEERQPVKEREAVKEEATS